MCIRDSQRDDRRYVAQCDELEAKKTIHDVTAALSELAACTVLEVRSLCMLCAERSLNQMTVMLAFFA